MKNLVKSFYIKYIHMEIISFNFECKKTFHFQKRQRTFAKEIYPHTSGVNTNRIHHYR